MKIFMKYAVLTCVFALLLCAVVVGDVIHMKDGRKLEGKIVSENKDTIRLKMAHGEIEIARKEIKEIEKTDFKPQEDLVKKLRREIATLKAENAELRERLRLLEELCKKAGLELPQAKDDDFEAEEIEYLGKKRSKAWFEKRYKKYRDRIAEVDGKFYNLCLGVELSILMPDSSYLMRKKGWFSFSPSGCKILQVTDKDGLLIRPEEGEIFRIEGFSTKGLADGDDWRPVPMIYIGTYQYTSTTGAMRTVHNYRVRFPLSKREFAEIIKQKLKLVWHELKEVKKPKHRKLKEKKDYDFEFMGKYYKIISIPEK